mmetsp:Transcript_42796/g.93086  ORF Transcript_42796/g.93086 Transcript_42796/m.93086 type:complete len:370 (-) Transcript_42796:493-1602(-)
MDWLILVGFACVPLVALLGILLGLLWSSERCPVSKVCLVARVENWSLASLAGMLATLVTVLLIGIFATETGYVNSTGHASGMAMFLTLLFAFYKFGFHELVQMSREAAWRIHATLGLMTLVMGLAHLVLVFQKLGAEVVFGHVPSVFGLVSLLLMLLGSLPAKFLIYDYFKLLHFLSFIGLLFTIYHMIEAAVRHRNLITIVTAVVNCAVLLAYVGQRSYVWAFARKAVVRKSEVIAEKDGEHIFLYLSVPGFSFKVGQWTRLWIPSLSSVAHPFTLIPANEPGADVALFIKAGGPAPRGPLGAAPDLPAGTVWTAGGRRGSAGGLRLWRRGDHPLPCRPGPVKRPGAALLGTAQRSVAAEGDGKIGAG